MIETGSFQNYTISLKGLSKTTLEQAFQGEVKYDLKITKKNPDHYKYLKGNSVDVTHKYSGVILNSSLACENDEDDTTYYYDTRQITKIECNGAINASLFQYLSLSYRMSDWNSTQNFL